MTERQCHGCSKQLEWGCEAKKLRDTKDGEDPRDAWFKPAKLPMLFDGEETYACPRQGLREDPTYWNRLLMLYGLFKKGHLPQQGAVIDQSNRLMQMFTLLDDANADCDAEMDKRAKQGKGPPEHMRR